MDHSLEQTAATIEDAARSIGFECVGRMAASQLQVRPEVRDMCAANRCSSYDGNWCCPPACGPIEKYQAEIDSRNLAVLLQTVGQLEDSFDFETMVETAKVHGRRLGELIESVRDAEGSPFFLGAGACTICPQCAYPDAPCRFPDKAFVSMEAAGLVVSEVCKAAGIPYNHGPNTLAYTACVLI